MDYIIRTLQSHHWGHCECTRYFLDQGNCKEISLENYECTSGAQAGIWWVLCPCPCSVFAVYQPSTLPLAPSVSQKTRVFLNLINKNTCFLTYQTCFFEIAERKPDVYQQ